jgi:hypothetical protein
MKRVLDLIIEFPGPLHNLLQHFTNRYLRLDTLDFRPHYTNPLLWNYSDFQIHCQFKSQSQSHIATDGQSVSLGCWAPSGAHDQILITFDSYGLLSVGRPLWREDGSVVCICYWPLPKQSFSGLSPFGLATIFDCLRWDSLFCRLLRLAGSRWRYSTPPPHGLASRYIASDLTSQKTRPLPSNGCPLSLHIRWNEFT